MALVSSPVVTGTFPPRLRLPEAASYLGVSPRSLALASWRERHRIPSFRIGRILVFDRDELDAYLTRCRDSR